MEHSVALYLCDARTVDPGTLSSLTRHLTPAELDRYENFLRAERRRQFLIGRALAWIAIAALFKVSPAEVTLELVSGRGPKVVRPQPLPGLSISHSGPWVACAVSQSVRIGLDVEQSEPGRDIDAIATHAFSDHLSGPLLQLPWEQRIRAFYRLWTEHEAKIKLGVTGDHLIQLVRGQLYIAIQCACSGRRPRLDIHDAIDLAGVL